MVIGGINCFGAIEDRGEERKPIPRTACHTMRAAESARTRKHQTRDPEARKYSTAGEKQPHTAGEKGSDKRLALVRSVV